MLPPTPSARVNVPGIGLIVTGVFGVLTSLGLMLVWALGGIAALADRDAAEALGGIGVLMGLTVIGLLISAFVAYAGLQMRRLRSWGVTMTGAILSMVPCGPCCILGLPFGIWAILVLIDEEVKQAFGGGGPGGPGSTAYGGYDYSAPPPATPPPGTQPPPYSSGPMSEPTPPPSPPGALPPTPPYSPPPGPPPSPTDPPSEPRTPER